MRNRGLWRMGVAGSFLLVAAGGQMGSSATTKFEPVQRDKLCVTEGKIEETEDQKLAVKVPKMRAYLLDRTPQNIKAHFLYLGSTAKKAALGSGESRQQFGLKLRAQDACNLVYAMWRFEPESEIVVSVKRNPGQHTSAQCGNRGYKNIKPRTVFPVPTPAPQEMQNLWAKLDGDVLKVIMNNLVVWEGSVGPLDFDGPVGIRSDNVKLEMQLWAAEPSTPPSQHSAGCKVGQGSE